MDGMVAESNSKELQISEVRLKLLTKQEELQSLKDCMNQQIQQIAQQFED